MNNIFIKNTLTRKKEEFKPQKEGYVSFYHCGPTVYWTQHLGNLRGMTLGDVVVRSLRYAGYEVTHIRNYTDVGHLTSDEDQGEDKMEKGAKRENKAPREIADKYISQFEEDTGDLNLLEPTRKPLATEHIRDMQEMVQTLLDKGYAYSTDLAIYFNVKKFPGYGQLSGQSLEDKKEGAGAGEVTDKGKKNPQDFALWFFKAGVHKNALQSWESPFESSLVENGRGFPGWHIECSAMSKKYLGDTIDIHMGGIEHIPVHHTNEIAQSEAANEAKFVNYWIHNGHLLVNDSKMAKSEGTGVVLADLKNKGFDPLSLRFFFLQAHYRSKQNFTQEALQAAENGLGHLYNQVRGLGEERGQIDADFKKEFIEALGDDFNTPQALEVTTRMLRSDIPEPNKLATIMDFDKVLGLNVAERAQESRQEQDIPQEIRDKAKERERLREEKRFEEADDLRKEIQDLGYIVEDSQEGSRIFKK